MRYLLDTNIVSDLVRNPQGRVAQHIRKVGEARVCTSIIVAAELRYGAAKRGSPRLSGQLEAVLGALEVLPFETPADAAYGSLRTRLEQAGKPIGGNDLLIAAQALALGCTIVTANEKEFARVEGLPRQNWLRSTCERLDRLAGFGNMPGAPRLADFARRGLAALVKLTAAENRPDPSNPIFPLLCTDQPSPVPSRQYLPGRWSSHPRKLPRHAHALLPPRF